MKLSPPSLKRASALLLCASVVLLTACASFKPKTPEEIVKERATARWQAMVSSWLTSQERMQVS